MATETSSRDPRRSSYGREYWLRRCEGFRVDSPDGRIGMRGVRLGASSQPEELAVRAGLFGRRLLFVPVTDLVEILPEERRVVLGESPELLGGGAA